MPTPNPAQPWPIRLAHWVHAPLLVLMAASGLQILTAYPYLGPRGGLFGWWPWQGVAVPAAIRAGGWLAGARHLHFAVAWFLVGNAVLYFAYFVGSGAWRDRVFRVRRDAAHAVRTGLYYLRVRKTPPPDAGLYNGLQRLGYTSALALGVVEVLSGLAMWKPVQLHFLVALFGSYDGARAVHLLGLLALAGFTAGHLLMVALHPRTLVEMITGRRKA